MRYYVTFPASAAKEPEPSVVDLVTLPGGKLQAQINGREVDLDVVAVRQQWSVLVDGRVVDLAIEGEPPELGALANGHRLYLRVESERMRSADHARMSGVVPAEHFARSPMPGRVVKVMVAPGDKVAPGQGLVVLEAMKMENEVVARAAATVAEVHIVPGATVEGGAKLVTFE